MKMTPDQLEFAISRYMDGVLSPLERQTLEQRLNEDPQARRMLEEYRQLDRAVRAAAPVPEVRWDRLAAHLSAAVAAQEAPVTTYPLYRRVVATMALAASLLLAFGVAIHVLRDGQHPTLLDMPEIMVQAPGWDIAAGPVIQEVSIGPSYGVSEAYWTDADGVLARPGRVIVARAHESERDPERLPF